MIWMRLLASKGTVSPLLLQRASQPCGVSLGRDIKRAQIRSWVPEFFISKNKSPQHPQHQTEQAVRTPVHHQGGLSRSAAASRDCSWACCRHQLPALTLPEQKTTRLKSGSSGGCGERSVAEVSMMSRLKRTPWMPLSSGMSSNSLKWLLAAGCLSRFLGEKTSRGLRNCLWICRLSRWK